MQVGMSFGTDHRGNIFGARLMGGNNQCLVLKLTTDAEGLQVLQVPEVWCIREYPHDGDHDFRGGGGSQ